MHYKTGLMGYGPFKCYTSSTRCICADENIFIRKGVVNIIEKAWINYKKRDFSKWSDNIRNVNSEIEYMPDIGIKYFEGLESFNKKRYKN